MHPSIQFCSLLLLLASQVLALIKIDRCTEGDQRRLEQGLREALDATDAALNGLNTGKLGDSEVAFRGAYDPLLKPEAKEFVTSTFARLKAMNTDPNYHVTIYCNGALQDIKMETSDATGPQWHDTLFTNKGTGERVSAILDQDAEDRRLGKKPGDSESFAVLGWAPDAPRKDFSDQAHIFVHNDAVNPATNGDFDTRWLSEIKQSGFDGNKNMLDLIRGTTTTVLHELLHVAGGLLHPTSRGARVTDGPGGKVYGWVVCMVIKDKFAELQIHTELCADCLMKFAQACYLQIQNQQNKPTCWSTGIVNKDTLEPALPGSGAKRRRDRVRRARARWHARSRSAV